MTERQRIICDAIKTNGNVTAKTLAVTLAATLAVSARPIERELIHVGLERECRKFVEDVQNIASKPIPLVELNASYQEESGVAVEGPWHKLYIKMFNKVRSFDKHVARRYDG